MKKVLHKLNSIPNILAIYIALGIVILDQFTKFLFKSIFSIGDSIVLIPKVLDLTLVYNQGAGFGLLQGQRIFFIIFTLLLLGGLIYYWKKIPATRYMAIPLGLIVGGTLGNLIDRAVFGFVTDFIYIHLWPVFNVADSAISIGVVWLIILIWKGKL